MACNDLVIITPTREREEQLSLVIDCMNNQTLKPDCWKIVDDGRKPVSQETLDKIQIPYEYVHWDNPDYPQNSILINSAKCLEDSDSDKYVFIDDDDYYCPEYVEFFSGLLENENEFVADGRWVDYRLSDGSYKEVLSKRFGGHSNSGAIWHSNGFRGERACQDLIATFFKRYAEGERRANDIVMERMLIDRGKYRQRFVDFKEFSPLSLKDFGTGNRGYCKAHRSNSGFVMDDEKFSYFKRILKDDWKRYEKYLGWNRKSHAD